MQKNAKVMVIKRFPLTKMNIVSEGMVLEQVKEYKIS